MRCPPAAADQLTGSGVLGPDLSRGTDMKLYRVNKLTKAGGLVIKRKDILASSDRAAVEQTRDNPDCPVCEVLHAGRTVGLIV